MSQDIRTHIKNLAGFAAKFFEVCLTILRFLTLKGSEYGLFHYNEKRIYDDQMCHTKNY